MLYIRRGGHTERMGFYIRVVPYLCAHLGAHKKGVEILCYCHSHSVEGYKYITGDEPLNRR